MPTIQPDVRKGDNALVPLAVSPKEARLLLGIGNTRLYQLIGSGELVTYHEGRARRITMASIRERVARLAGTPANAEPSPPRAWPAAQSIVVE